MAGIILSVVIQILAVIIAGYIAIIKIFPIFKKMLAEGSKDDKIPRYIMTVLVVYTGIFMLKFILNLLGPVNSQATDFIVMIKPGVELLTENFFIWTFIALIFATVLRRK